ncbi:MAG TPA: nuclease PIN [Acidimicrobiaceae bacterium]|nr:nuclease PIN [Acidimicrobiaceae bacterium]
MVERAVPNCWDVMSAEDVRTTQVILTGEALARCLGGPDDGAAAGAVTGAADGAVTDEIADEIAGAVMLETGRSFITPFDRGDIEELIGSMDDAIDQMKKTAKAITLYEVERFEPGMVELGAVIVQAAERVATLLPMLRDIKKHAIAIGALAKEIGAIEERSDEIHGQGLKELFRAHRTGDAMGFIVGAEIYDHLEKVVDRFEDVAKRVSRIVLEHL